MIKTDAPAAIKRIYGSMAVLAVAGAGASAWWGGAPSLLGWSLGACFSVLNFWLLGKAVDRLGSSASGTSSAALTGVRYLGFGAVAYVILTFFEGNIFAALIGCFLAVAAVLLEALYELIHGT